MEFLKKLFADGALTWEQFKEAVKEMKLVDLKQGEYVSKDKYDNLLTEKNNLTTQLGDRDKQLEELKKIDHEGLKSRIAELETENANAKAQSEKQIHELKANNAIEMALKSSNAKNNKAVRALLNLDIDNVKFTEDGTIEGLSELIEGIKESDSYLFESGNGGFKGAPPQDGNPNPVPPEPKTYADFLKLELSKGE